MTSTLESICQQQPQKNKHKRLGSENSHQKWYKQKWCSKNPRSSFLLPSFLFPRVTNNKYLRTVRFCSRQTFVTFRSCKGIWSCLGWLCFGILQIWPKLNIPSDSDKRNVTWRWNASWKTKFIHLTFRLFRHSSLEVTVIEITTKFKFKISNLLTITIFHAYVPVHCFADKEYCSLYRKL